MILPQALHGFRSRTTMKDRGEDRKLAAIVMADVVGYSRLMGADESGTLAAMTRHRRAFIDPTVAAHHGRLVNAPGDSLLLEFLSVINAVRCAIALQQGMSARNRDEDAARRINLRIGVNIGDIIVQKGEIFGDGVNVAARLENLAEAGGICISRAAHEQIRNAIDIAFVDLGAHAVKNIARPIEVYALSAAVIAALPPLLAAPEVGPAPMWRRPPIRAAALIGIVLAASGAAFLAGWDHKPESLRQRLETALGETLPNSADKSRTKLVASYLATPHHRAFVLAPKTQSRWYSGDWTTGAEAADKNLERCQAAFAEPCAVMAVDDDMVAKGDGPWPIRDMPRTRYAGTFNPYWIPGVRSSAIKKPEVAGYARAPGPKAVAYNVRGLVFVVTGTASQYQAEFFALKTCNGAPTPKDIDEPCLLYAVENQVILPERRTLPRTAP